MRLFHKKKKILVVEDEPDIQAGIRARLELDDFLVITASDGQQGVQMARSEKPDLIILDVMIPLLNGYDVLNLLKNEASTKGIPILVLTALPHVEDPEESFHAGADDFLNKPYSNERLK